MCGRFADFLEQRELEYTFAITSAADDARLLPPSWNIAPAQSARIIVPAVALEGASHSPAGTRCLQTAR